MLLWWWVRSTPMLRSTPPYQRGPSTPYSLPRRMSQPHWEPPLQPPGCATIDVPALPPVLLSSRSHTGYLASNIIGNTSPALGRTRCHGEERGQEGQRAAWLWKTPRTTVQCSESPYSHKQVLPRVYLTLYLVKAIKVSSVSLSKLSPSIHSCW